MGYFIKELTYEQLRPLITERSVVVLPIGGGAKEHGNHLPMGTDYFVTDWVANAVTARENVLTLPTPSVCLLPGLCPLGGLGQRQPPALYKLRSRHSGMLRPLRREEISDHRRLAYQRTRPFA